MVQSYRSPHDIAAFCKRASFEPLVHSDFAKYIELTLGKKIQFDTSHLGALWESVNEFEKRSKNVGTHQGEPAS
jgi:hypothetical protein